jgi:ketosteroid isomerase-like protein
MNDDRFAILELLNRYILSIDTHDDAAFADNFHDDAVYVSPFGTASGREQILATIHQWHAGGVTAGKRHMIGAWRIDVDGSQATSTSSYWVVNAKEGTAIVASGGYSDVLTKRNGVWKLQKRVQTVDPSFRM